MEPINNLQQMIDTLNLHIEEDVEFLTSLSDRIKNIQTKLKDSPNNHIHFGTTDNLKCFNDMIENRNRLLLEYSDEILKCEGRIEFRRLLDLSPTFIKGAGDFDRLWGNWVKGARFYG